MGDARAGHDAGQCRSCPVCLLLGALDDLSPDARRHLAAAGRELVLAWRAVASSGGGARAADDVWDDESCGTSAVPADAHRAHGPQAPVTPLRHIAVD